MGHMIIQLSSAHVGNFLAPAFMANRHQHMISIILQEKVCFIGFDFLYVHWNSIHSVDLQCSNGSLLPFFIVPFFLSRYDVLITNNSQHTQSCITISNSSTKPKINNIDTSHINFLHWLLSFLFLPVFVWQLHLPRVATSTESTTSPLPQCPQAHSL